MKKSKIEEIIDGNVNLIGSDDETNGISNRETMANKTTDYNATVGGQNFKNDFLGRFGFYFYESEEDGEKLRDDLASLMYNKFRETMEYYHENPDMLEKDFNFQKDKDFSDQPKEKKEHDYEWADKVMDLIEPHLKKKINESRVAEDKMVDKKSNKLKSKKDDDKELNDKLKKITDIIDDLPTHHKNKFNNILEEK